MKFRNRNEFEYHPTKECMECKKCHDTFVFAPEDTWFDENGFGYSTKLTKCKHCDCINVVKYYEDYGFSKLNTDSRLF